MSIRTQGVIATGVIALLAAVLWINWPDLVAEPIAAGVEAQATPEQIETGEYLARAGNCIGCHTERGQAEYAGGRAIGTPFGNIFSTNLTPDAETGIGAWTSADFFRAMRHGRSKDGRRLYPAFPYTNYTLISREDSDAIFAFLRSRAPVESPRIPPDLRFPYNTTLALMAWRALYFRPGQYVPDEGRSDVWNRGAYLTEGLGHCSACHTPRGSLGNIDPALAYAGGEIPSLGWDAPPLNPLTSDETSKHAQAEQMAALLKTGVSKRGVATGPMAEVVFHSLQYLDREDIDAIVDYVQTLPRGEPRSVQRGPRVPERQRQTLLTRGASLYAEQCSDCHGMDGEGEAYKYPALAANGLVTSPSPSNLIRSVLFGGFAPSTEGNPRPYGMPPYSHQLADDEIAAILAYIRNAWGNGAPPVSVTEVARY